MVFDSFELEDLRPSFLRDYITLPDEMFTVSSMKQLQNFIDEYGTHFVRSASFGGRFYIRVVSTSETFKESNSFNEAADIEISSMQGQSSKREEQISSAVDTKHSRSTDSKKST